MYLIKNGVIQITLLVVFKKKNCDKFCICRITHLFDERRKWFTRISYYVKLFLVVIYYTIINNHLIKP